METMIFYKDSDWYLEQTPQWDEMVEEGWKFLKLLSRYGQVGIEMSMGTSDGETAVFYLSKKLGREEINTRLLHLCQCIAYKYKDDFLCAKCLNWSENCRCYGDAPINPKKRNSEA